MSENINPIILDKITKVCTCRGITRATLKKAIADGNKTVEAINKATGTGSGACKGKNCGEKIQRLLESQK